MEEWRPIRDFNGYSISDQGNVLNVNTGRVLRPSQNQKRLVIVGIMRGGVQYKRAISHLVADAYLLPPPHESFDAVINLDGDRHNNHVTNLMWRPTWFAMKYNAQFTGYAHGYGHAIIDLESKEVFDNIWHAVTKHGLLIFDVVESLNTQRVVWPTYQRFKAL